MRLVAIERKLFELHERSSAAFVVRSVIHQPVSASQARTLATNNKCCGFFFSTAAAAATSRNERVMLRMRECAFVRETMPIDTVFDCVGDACTTNNRKKGNIFTHSALRNGIFAFLRLTEPNQLPSFTKSFQLHVVTFDQCIFRASFAARIAFAISFYSFCAHDERERMTTNISFSVFLIEKLW